MCGDLNDPDDQQFGATLNFFAPAFNYDASVAAAHLDTTPVTVSELVVQAPNKPTQPFDLVELGTISIADFLPQQVMVPNVALVTVPPFDFLVGNAQATPCVQSSPSSVDINTLNGAMVFSGASAYQQSMIDGNEWGGIVYQTPDGSLHQTLPFTGGSPNSMTVHIPFPAGAVVLGYVHTHPATAGVDETTPSPNTQGPASDESFVDALISSGKGDPNMVTYIATQGSDGKFHMYAYDKDHLHNPPTGCQVQPAT